MKTAAQVAKEARAEARAMDYSNMVVMDRNDFNYLLAETARNAFAAGKAAAVRKPRKQRGAPDDDFQASSEDA